jgi:hypothetical protein
MRLTTSVLTLACAAALAGCGSEPQGGSSPREIVLPVFVTSNTSHQFGPAGLAGENERPVPVDTKARGNATFTLSEDGRSVHYKLIVANIDHVTQSHIHIAPVDSAGPVVVFLFGFVAGGVTENGVLAEGDFTAANLIARPAIGFGATMPELVAAMTNGRAYVNVHTVQYPAGEIRGQIDERGPSR